MPWPYRSAQAVKIQGGTVPVKPDKQALLDGVKAAYTQAKQNADAAAAAAEDVANAMKQLEDDEELALLRTDNKAAIKALTAEEAKNALNMLHPDTLDTAAAPMGNLKVMPTDILPLALCDQDWVDEMGKVIMADGRPYLTTYQHDQLVPFCMWWTISRFPEFQGQLAASEMPWKAVPDDDGHVLGRPFAPQPMLASPFQNFPLVMPWMGCRCAWPVSQLGYYSICWACGLSKWVALAVEIIITCMELLYLDTLLMQRFYQYAPNSRSWDYIAKQRSPLTIRVTEVVIDFIFMPLFIGLLAFGSDSSKNENYFETKTMYRILLRSLSTKEAGQTFAYCTLVTWSVLTEIGSVIFPAYITFMAPVIFHVVYSGEVLTDMASFILLFNTIFEFEQKALWLVQFAACLTEEQRTLTTTFVQGHRAKAEIRAVNQAYLWFAFIVIFSIFLTFKSWFSILWIWVVPFSMFYYTMVIHSVPYCMNGWTACPGHTMPCMCLTFALTSLTMFSLFILKHGCFMFPCLCKEEVPGWLFFPSSTALTSPLRGIFDVNLWFFERPVTRLIDWFTAAAWDDDCRWEPTASSFKSQAFMWRVWRVTGIGPDECLKPTYGGCSDPWERDDTLADEEVNGGSLGTLGGFDNQRQG